MKPDATEEGIRDRWGEAAAELLSFEGNRAKRNKYGSISNFIRAEATTTNRSVASLWRILSVGRFYEEVRKKLGSQKRHIPKLDDPDFRASVEPLELLSKISRVAPRELVELLEVRTLEGSVSRGQLRSIWATYRPVLEGKTKRGRGASAPVYNPRSLAMQGALIEANVIARILDVGPGWLGSKGHPNTYKMIHIAGNQNLRSAECGDLDAIILFQEAKEDALTLHGVKCILNARKDRLRGALTLGGTGVDFIWVASPKKLDVKPIREVDHRIGILWANATTVEVIQKPTRLEGTIENGEFRERLLRSLIIEVTKSPQSPLPEPGDKELIPTKSPK
jgi:hypothetical protein